MIAAPTPCAAREPLNIRSTRPGAQQRGGGEEAEADDEKPASAEAVGQRARRDDRCRQREGVGVDDRLQAREAGVEVVGDCRQRGLPRRCRASASPWPAHHGHVQRWALVTNRSARCARRVSSVVAGRVLEERRLTAAVGVCVAARAVPDGEPREPGEGRGVERAGAVLARVARHIDHQPVGRAVAEQDAALQRAQMPPSPLGKAAATRLDRGGWAPVPSGVRRKRPSARATRQARAWHGPSTAVDSPRMTRRCWRWRWAVAPAGRVATVSANVNRASATVSRYDVRRRLGGRREKS